MQLIQPTQDLLHLKSWWEEAATKIAKQEKRRFNGMVIYTLWNIWKAHAENKGKVFAWVMVREKILTADNL